MASFFKWGGAKTSVDTSRLGASMLAMSIAAGCTIPQGCAGVIVGSGGRARRIDEGSRVNLGEGESAWCFHPGPYSIDIAPFAQAPEIGLRVGFTVDAPDPRMVQQRFDLFLASEGTSAIAVCEFGAAIEAAVRHELAQGNLDLPPCTSPTEWNVFRGAFNQLLYMRFGVTVDDCVPVDLGETVDYARLLLARLEDAPAAVVPEIAALEPVSDAQALRRLFLELPCVMCGLRLAVLPPGQELFRQHQALLQRLDLVSLSVNTMPALELKAPGLALAAGEQQRRLRHSARAAASLDEAWALLARLQAPGAPLEALFDDAERIVANLEYDVGARRESEAV